LKPLKLFLWLVNLIGFGCIYYLHGKEEPLYLFWLYANIAVFVGLLLIFISFFTKKKTLESKFSKYRWLFVQIIWILAVIFYAIWLKSDDNIVDNIKLEELMFLQYCVSTVFSLLILVSLFRFIEKSKVVEKDDEKRGKIIPLHINLTELKKYFGSETWIGKERTKGKKDFKTELEDGTQKTRRIFIYTWIWVFVLFTIMYMVLCIKGFTEQSVDINKGVLSMELKFDTIPEKNGTLVTFVPKTTPYDSTNFIIRSREKSDLLSVSLNCKLSLYDSTKIDSLSTFMYVYESSKIIDTVIAGQKLKFPIKIKSRKLFDYKTLELNNANKYTDSVEVTDTDMLKNEQFKYNKKSYRIDISGKKGEKFHIQALQHYRWLGIVSDGVDMFMNVLLLILFATLHIRTKVFENERNDNSYIWIGTLVFFAFGLITTLNIVNIFILDKKETLDFLIDLVIAIFSVIAVFGVWGSISNNYTKINSVSKLILFIYATAQIFGVFQDRKVEIFMVLQFISIAGRMTIFYEIVKLFSRKRIAWYYINEANEARTKKSLEEFQDIFKEGVMIKKKNKI
jgi:hypothetical protein